MAFLAPIGAAIGGAFSQIGIGTALSAGASVLGTISAVGASNYQAKVAANNAMIAEQNAEQASDRSQNEQLEADRETAALIGQQEAIQGASGLTGASQLRTRRSAQRLGRQDAENIRLGGDREIQNFRQQAENFRAEGRAAKTQGRGAILGGIFDVGSSLIGGAKGSRNANRITSGGAYDPWTLRNGRSLRRVTA